MEEAHESTLHRGMQLTMAEIEQHWVPCKFNLNQAHPCKIKVGIPGGIGKIPCRMGGIPGGIVGIPGGIVGIPYMLLGTPGREGGIPYMLVVIPGGKVSIPGGS